MILEVAKAISSHLELSDVRGALIKEAQRLEFRAEAFNLTNSFRMDIPNANTTTSTFQIITSSTFGQVTSSRDPRIMQFALKYFF